jgi:hypothetical protein
LERGVAEHEGEVEEEVRGERAFGERGRNGLGMGRHGGLQTGVDG